MINLVKRLFGGGQAARRSPRVPRPRMNGSGLPPRSISRTQPAATDLLDNPSLRVDTSDDEGFDPYNTGIFNRSGSWERINKRRNS